MSKKLKIVAVVLSLALWQCEVKEHSNNSDNFDFEHLVGGWESVDEKSHQIEEWQKLGDAGLEGKGYVLTEGDTTFIEFLKIDLQDSVPVYYAQVRHQNHNHSVPFYRTKESKEEIEFSNPTHDFPKKIVYRLINEDQMQVYIEGPRNNSTARITFDFVRFN